MASFSSPRISTGTDFQTLASKDLARGIDARSSEDNLAEGYSEDIVNLDTNSEGSLSLRRGYAAYAGAIPIRVSSVSYVAATNKITFTLALPGYDGVNWPLSSIMVYGALSATWGGGDLSTTPGAVWYRVVDSSVNPAPRVTITVVANAAALAGNHTDNDPRMVVYGVIAGSTAGVATTDTSVATRGLAAYSRQLTKYLTAWWGGCLYRARGRDDEASTATTYLMPSQTFSCASGGSVLTVPGTPTGLVPGDVLAVGSGSPWVDSYADRWVVRSVARVGAGPTYTITLDHPMTSGVTSGTYRLEARWTIVEGPGGTGIAVPRPPLQMLSANGVSDVEVTTGQVPVSMAEVNGSLFSTNGLDSVQKYDGSHCYLAGLSPWQPGITIVAEPPLPAQLTFPTFQAAVSSVDQTYNPPANNGPKFVLAAGAAATTTGGFRAGDSIQHTSDNAVYEVTSVQSLSAADEVYVSSPISSAVAGTIVKRPRVRYYFRLNAVDANNNVVGSRATASQDFIVQAYGRCRISGSG